MALDPRLSSRETLRFVFPDADSDFSAADLAARPPWKPHEMAQQVPSAVIPADLKDEKRENLASVHQAMTDVHLCPARGKM